MYKDLRGDHSFSYVHFCIPAFPYSRIPSFVEASLILEKNRLLRATLGILHRFSKATIELVPYTPL